MSMVYKVHLAKTVLIIGFVVLVLPLISNKLISSVAILALTVIMTKRIQKFGLKKTFGFVEYDYIRVNFPSLINLGYYKGD